MGNTVKEIDWFEKKIDCSNCNRVVSRLEYYHIHDMVYLGYRFKLCDTCTRSIEESKTIKSRQFILNCLVRDNKKKIRNHQLKILLK